MAKMNPITTLREGSGPLRGALLISFCYVWCAYVMLFDPSVRFSSVVYDSPKEIMPIKAWGALLLALTIAHIVGLLRPRTMFMGILQSGFVMWFTVFGLAILDSAQAQTSAGRFGVGLFAALAIMHLSIALWPEREK